MNKGKSISLGNINGILHLNQEGDIILNKGYVATEITEAKARVLRDGFDSWKNMQAWASGGNEVMASQAAMRLAGRL